MKRLCVCAASLLIAGSVVAWAQQAEPATQPSDTEQTDSKAPAARASGRWGFAPFNRLSSVTDEQKRKIDDIHRRANAEIKAIRDKEEADIMAILTEEQKAELAQMEADRKAEAAKKRAERKEKKTEEKDK